MRDDAMTRGNDSMTEDFPAPGTAAEAERVDAIAAHMREIIRLLGEDPEREGLLRTPQRAARALWHCTQGYRQEPVEVLNGALFDAPGSGMVVVRDIEFYSMCEHHVLPFHGTVSIGYLPGGKILGLSKLARLVNLYARRLQVQERLTAELADALMELVPGCRGVAVSCRASHMCMMMRGVEKQLSSTVTLETRGAFDSEPSLMAQFAAMTGAPSAL